MNAQPLGFAPIPLSRDVTVSTNSKLAFEMLDRQEVRKGFLTVERLTFRQRRADGTWSAPFHREVIERGHAVAAVVHDPRLDRLLFVRQLRPGGVLNGQPFLLELLAGMIEHEEVDGRTVMEDPEITLRRESEEEALLTLGSVTRIGSFLMSAGGSSETTTMYYAQADLATVAAWGGCPSENEVIEIVTMGVDEAFEALAEGQFNTASAGIGLYWLQAQRAMGHYRPT